MRKTALRRAENLVAEARAVLGTKTATETIHRARAAVVARDGRTRLFERLGSIEGIDLTDEAVMREAWRWVMARYVADKSALARIHLGPVAPRMESLFLAGEVVACGIVDLDLLFSARTSADYLAILANRRSLPRAEVGEAGIERAVEVQTALAPKGSAPGPGDSGLLIAAAAEAAGPGVLRYDADFDRVAAVPAS